MGEDIKQTSLDTKEVVKPLFKRERQKSAGRNQEAVATSSTCLQNFTDIENRNVVQSVGCRVIITGEILRPGRKNTKT